MDIGKLTVKEILEKKLGTEKSKKVLDSLNDAHKAGKKDEELHKHLKDSLEKEGYDTQKDESGIVYGFVFPIP